MYEDIIDTNTLKEKCKVTKVSITLFTHLLRSRIELVARRMFRANVPGRLMNLIFVSESSGAFLMKIMPHSNAPEKLRS